MKLLIPVRADHAEALYGLIKDSAITDTIQWDGPESLNDFREGLAEREALTQNGQLHQFTILDPETRRPIGSADIRPTRDNPRLADVGLWVGKPFQSKGIGAKAIQELIEYGFNTIEVEDIEAHIFVGNVASRKAFENCGFALKETMPRAAFKRGRELDQWVMTLNKASFLENASLFERFSNSELNSLLINEYSQRAVQLSPSQVLSSWENDRFVQPVRVSPLDTMLFEATAFEAAKGFEPIELSPVSPLGTCKTVAPLSQKKILSTIRGLEVVADSTNVMALQCAVRRRKLIKENPKDISQVKLCSSHRLLRVQKFKSPEAMAHFRVFAMCSAGRDEGSDHFEVNVMLEHISVYIELLKKLSLKGFLFSEIRVGLYGNESPLLTKVVNALGVLPEIYLEKLGPRKSSYYPNVSFKMWAKTQEGSEHELADGGMVDWTQKLVGSAKERLMISGIGVDRPIQYFYQSKPCKDLDV